jgi:hypothetical protein
MRLAAKGEVPRLAYDLEKVCLLRRHTVTRADPFRCCELEQPRPWPSRSFNPAAAAGSPG